MDKKTIIGLAIIGAILFAFSWYSNKQQMELREQQALVDSINRANLQEFVETQEESPLQDSENAETDSLGRDRYQQQLAASLGEYLYNAQSGTEEFYILENDLMTVKLSTKGGQIEDVVLKNYKSYNGTPLHLFEENSSRFNLSFYTSQTINTDLFFFTPVKKQEKVLTASDTEKSFAMRLYADSASYLEYIYTIRPEEYMLDFNVRFVNMENRMARNQTYLDLEWENTSEQNEKGFENENNYSTIAYRYPNDSSIEELSRSTGSKNETINSEIQWVAFKQQFFSSILIAKEGFMNGSVEFDTYEPHSGKIKDYSAQLTLPYSPQQSQYDLQFFFGPNNYRTLKKYDMEMQKVIPLGGKWISWISTLIIIPFFDWLGHYISNYGLIILLLTILIKLILFPFTYKSYLSMAKMRLLQPEIQSLNEKYPKPEDAMKKQQATMALYKSAGVSPFGGCLPMLLQMPILFAMFRFFPSSIELRQKGFLWADDLSAYDNVLDFGFNIPLYGDHISLFALLTAATMIISQKLTQMPQQNNQSMPGMKMMMYLMPIMFLFWFNNSASGLSYYYLLSNIITIGQTFIMRKVVNEDKLHARMHANKVNAKPKKKSKFMQRYEEAVKQQQQIQSTRGQQNKKR